MTTPRPLDVDARGFGRRRFLAGTAGVAALPLAGCLNRIPLAAEQRFGAPRELIQMDGRERHLVFGDDDDSELSFMLRQDVRLPATPGSHPERIPFRVVVVHRKGLRTDRLTLRHRAPAADGSAFDGNVYLRTPATGVSASVTLDRTPDGWTVLDAADLGKPPAGRSIAPGETNVTLGFVVDPLSSHPTEELYVEFEAELSEPRIFGRHSRTATGRLAFPTVRG
ncbi:MAG: hypothetical protein ACI9YT_001887 [Halobacteriales archaeon]|jgi:hypothetical protein